MRRQVEVDKFHKGMVVMSEVHNLVHKGRLFSIHTIDESLADAGTLEILIQCNEGLHARLELSATGQGVGRFFSGTTFSAAGSAITPVNRNGFSSNTLSGVTFTTAPTITLAGTESVAQVIPGGAKVRAVGSSAEGFSEWILAPGDYLIRFTNTAGTNVAVSLGIECYQPNQR